MSTWFALALPALPLQLARRTLDPALARTLVLAIVDGPVQRGVVIFCNRRARAAGVAPGMKLAAAQALAHDLVAIGYSAAREQDALQELACWAYQFSACIVPYRTPGGSGLVMETGASERLFGGRAALHGCIVGALRHLGYRATAACAPTPAAARVLARARAGTGAPVDGTAADTDLAGLPAVLAPLPLALLGWEEPVNETLQTLGLVTIGQLLALPRDAFARRFGARRLTDLDRLLGKIPDPQPPFAPPERFQARIELPADLVDAQRLLVPAQRLLHLLEGFLRGHGAGATALLLRVHHSPRRDRAIAPTAIALGLAAPERDPRRLLRLFTERMDRVRLPEPAVLLDLELERMAPLLPHHPSFLPPAPQACSPGGTAGGAAGPDALQLAEILHARLGPQGVFQLQAASDHRPERAYRVVPFAAAASPAAGLSPSLTPPAAQRPLLILPAPRRLRTPAADAECPHYGGPLALLAGPERIEAGWWDLGHASQAGVHRDYFVARNERGQTLWIYRELATPRNWFLHGFFG